MPFPAAPTVGELHDEDEQTYEWTAGGAWVLRRQFVVQVVRWTPNPGTVAVIEVQRLNESMAPVGSPEYLTGIPPAVWGGDPGTLLDNRP